MPHFFISHAKKDTRNLALQLTQALNTMPNLSAWMDESMRAGRSWELQIQTEIDRCDVMVVLLSEDLHRHTRGQKESYVLREIAYAQYGNNPKIIIPVMAQPTKPPLSLIMEQYIDMMGMGLSVEQLIQDICYEAGVDVAAPPKTESLSTGGFANPPRQSQPIKIRPSSLDLMPVPFAWVDIPAGRVTLEIETGFYGGGQTFDIEAFQMAKYPVTNAQFAKFIDAGGYENRQWWTDAGWETHQKDNWMQPRFWTDAKWNGAEYPVVGVSWYESVAFCLWLNEVTGEQIMLPSEVQWQRAAQGDDGREYPWGNDWDSSRCRNSVDGGYGSAGNTGIVTAYEGKGDSPYGVVDMSGNVWEWCLTKHEDGSQNLNGNNMRVLHGGSWNNKYRNNFRVADRIRDVPNLSFNGGGFRVSRSY